MLNGCLPRAPPPSQAVDGDRASWCDDLRSSVVLDQAEMKLLIETD